MRALHNTLQVRDLGVGVALGGGEALVAEERLDVADVRTGTEKMSGDAVAEGVAGDVLLHPGLLHPGTHDPQDVAAGERSSPGLEKEPRPRSTAPGSATITSSTQESWPAEGRVGFESQSRRPSEGHLSPLLPLPHHHPEPAPRCPRPRA